jgi:phage terminase small subunit
MTPTRRVAPSHLAKPTQLWWRSVLQNYELDDHHERLLTLAAEAYDRSAEAREAVAQDGAYFTNAKGEPRPHPGLAIERDTYDRYGHLMPGSEGEVAGLLDGYLERANTAARLAQIQA